MCSARAHVRFTRDISERGRNIRYGPKGNMPIPANSQPAPTPRGEARHSRPFHLGRVAAGRGEMNMEISGARIGELPFDCLF